MVDDEIDGGERVDLLCVAAKRLHGIAHGGKIDDGRNASEILHQHAGGAKGDFPLGLAAIGQPVGNALNVLLPDGAPVFIAQQILEQDLQGIGQLRNPGQPVLFGSRQRIIAVKL
jgi:hypothetical protein